MFTSSQAVGGRASSCHYGDDAREIENNQPWAEHGYQEASPKENMLKKQQQPLKVYSAAWYNSPDEFCDFVRNKLALKVQYCHLLVKLNNALTAE